MEARLEGLSTTVGAEGRLTSAADEDEFGLVSASAAGRGRPGSGGGALLPLPPPPLPPNDEE